MVSVSQMFKTKPIKMKSLKRKDSKIKFENGNNLVVDLINYVESSKIYSLNLMPKSKKKLFRDEIVYGISQALVDVGRIATTTFSKIAKEIKHDFENGITYDMEREAMYIADRATYILITKGHKMFFQDSLDKLIKTELVIRTTTSSFSDEYDA